MFTKDKKFYKSFAILTLTLMLEQAVVLSVNLADNIMLGGYSETALSGVAAVNQIQFILQQLVFAVSNSIIILGSQYWGQKNTEPIRKIMSVAFCGAAAIVVILFSLVSLFPRGAVGIFTNDGAIIKEGVKYILIIRFTYPFFAVTNVLLGGLRTVEKVSIALYTSVISLIVNCTINFLLIKGNFGFPELGVKGAAIGTLTARILEFIIVSFYILKKDKIIGWRVSEFKNISVELTKDFMKVSVPVLITGFLWGLNTALQTVILGHMSSNAIAAHSISSTVFLFLKVTSVGAASAASIIIGKAVGSGNMSVLKEYVRTLQVLFIAIGISIGSILFFIRKPFLSLYNLSPETESLAGVFMIIEATVLVFMSYQMCMNIGVIRGGGDTKFVMIMDFVAIWCVCVPLSLLAAFVFKLSPVAVLILLNCDQYLKCIPAAIYGNSYRWVKNLTRTKE